MSNNLKAVLFGLAGLAVGVGIGILLAPDAGNETRRKLKYATDRVKKRLGLDKEDFSDSELEMDAIDGRSY